jgi:glycosyltransferase involved in cell wall biosynthesis
VRVAIDARTVTRRRSGIGNYVQALVRHLVPLDDTLELALLRIPGDAPTIIEHERVTEHPCSGDPKGLPGQFRAKALRAVGAYDLYHAPGDTVPFGARKPWVVTHHDLMWVEAPELASGFAPVRLINGAWFGWNFRRALSGASRVIAISQSTADAVGRVYPHHFGKVRVIHHGFDHAQYSPDAAGPRSLLDQIVPEGARYSLIVGQGSPYKNHMRMVRAFAEATADRPNHKLVLVRRFSRVDSPMTKLLDSPDVRDRVITLPHVTDELLLALLRHAHMLLFASLYEGFGMPSLEAMAMGTPVLGSTAAAVAEVTGDAALHVNPTSHEELVAGIRRLDEDEALRSRLIEAGPRRVLDFDWERCARDTLAVYREAVGAQAAA